MTKLASAPEILPLMHTFGNKKWLGWSLINSWKGICGIVGDSLNGLTDSLRRQGEIEWIGVRHEELAAFAAGAEGFTLYMLKVVMAGRGGDPVGQGDSCQ